jgi:hypothetical protein
MWEAVAFNFLSLGNVLFAFVRIIATDTCAITSASDNASHVTGAARKSELTSSDEYQNSMHLAGTRLRTDNLLLSWRASHIDKGVCVPALIPLATFYVPTRCLRKASSEQKAHSEDSFRGKCSICGIRPPRE